MSKEDDRLINCKVNLSCTFKTTRTKSYDETCVQNPQSCAWLVVRQNKFGTQNQNEMYWHQKPIRWHSDQRKFLEATPNDGSPTAKARPANLVTRSQYLEETSSSSLGSRVNTESDDGRNELARHQETGSKVIRNQKSKVLKWVDKRGFSQPPGNWAIGWNPNKERRKFSRHKEICCMLARVQNNGIHEPSIYGEDLSKFGQEVGKVRNQCDILNRFIQDRCIDMERCF